MINQRLENFQEHDLVDFIKRQVPEGSTIEYKRDVQMDTREQKAEFLADLTSFANTSGGDLIAGILEDQGCPVEIKGIKIDDYDKWVLQVENLIRDSVEPRIQCTIHSVAISEFNYVIIFQIKKSWIRPHRVLLNWRFYMRNSAGKYPLDTTQLRHEFLASALVGDRMRQFRDERIENILKKVFPCKLSSSRLIVVHFVPHSSFASYQLFNVKELEVFSSLCHNSRPNLDGILQYGYGRDYVQVFRNGAVEWVSSKCVRQNNDSILLLPEYELDVIRAAVQIMRSYKALSIDFPVSIFLSLVDVKGAEMDCGNSYFPIGEGHYSIDRDVVQVPDIQLENVNCTGAANDEEMVELFSAFLPAFEIVWNACGYERALSYRDGKYVGVNTWP